MKTIIKFLDPLMNFWEKHFFPKSHPTFRHLMTGIVIASVAMVIFYFFTRDAQVGLSIMITFFVSILRELYGVQKSGAKFDGIDIISTTIGGVIGSIIVKSLITSFLL